MPLENNFLWAKEYDDTHRGDYTSQHPARTIALFKRTRMTRLWDNHSSKPNESTIVRLGKHDQSRTHANQVTFWIPKASGRDLISDFYLGESTLFWVQNDLVPRGWIGEFGLLYFLHSKISGCIPLPVISWWNFQYSCIASQWKINRIKIFFVFDRDYTVKTSRQW